MLSITRWWPGSAGRSPGATSTRRCRGPGTTLGDLATLSRPARSCTHGPRVTLGMQSDRLEVDHQRSRSGVIMPCAPWQPLPSGPSISMLSGCAASAPDLAQLVAVHVLEQDVLRTRSACVELEHMLAAVVFDDVVVPMESMRWASGNGWLTVEGPLLPFLLPQCRDLDPPRGEQPRSSDTPSVRGRGRARITPAGRNTRWEFTRNAYASVISAYGRLSAPLGPAPREAAEHQAGALNLAQPSYKRLGRSGISHMSRRRQHAKTTLVTTPPRQGGGPGPAVSSYAPQGGHGLLVVGAGLGSRVGHRHRRSLPARHPGRAAWSMPGSSTQAWLTPAGQ